MAIDIKNLQKIINLCRKTGVSEIEHEGLRLKFGDLPTKKRYGKKEEASQIETKSPYSEEDVLFWSSTGPLGGAN